MSLHDTWQIYLATDTLLATVRRASMVQWKTAMDVYLGSSSNSHNPDYVIRGDYFEKNVNIYQGAQQAALVYLAPTNKHTNSLSVSLRLSFAVESLSSSFYRFPRSQTSCSGTSCSYSGKCHHSLSLSVECFSIFFSSSSPPSSKELNKFSMVFLTPTKRNTILSLSLFAVESFSIFSHNHLLTIFPRSPASCSDTSHENH
jgi:hypothetical protein